MMLSDQQEAPACGHPGCASGAGLRLTPWRARVLEALRREGRALGAYDLIGRFTAQDGKAASPISIYRALDGLMEAGLIHRLASKNAYFPCERRHCAAESIAFLVCEACGEVTEAPSKALAGDLRSLVDGTGFVARSEAIEILGRCARCQGEPA